MVRRFLISLSAASGILAFGFEETISNIGKSGSAGNATIEVVFPKANFVDQRAENWEQSSPLANKKCASLKSGKTEGIPLPTPPEQSNGVIHSETANPAPHQPPTPSAPSLPAGSLGQTSYSAQAPYNPQTRPIGWMTPPL